MPAFSDNRSKWTVWVAGLPFGFLLCVIIIFSVIDIYFYPNTSLRLTWWQRFGLPVNKKIASHFLPKAKSKEDLTKFQPQTLYWLYKDKVGLSLAEGYACGVEGDILSAGNFEWKIMTGKGQEVRLDLVKQPVKYYWRNPYYDEETDEWTEGNRVAAPSDFSVNNKVRVTWDCPVENPGQMIDGKGIIKQEYLKVVPVSISKAMSTDESF